MAMWRSCRLNLQKAPGGISQGNITIDAQSLNKQPDRRTVFGQNQKLKMSEIRCLFFPICVK